MIAMPIAAVTDPSPDDAERSVSPPDQPKVVYAEPSPQGRTVFTVTWPSVRPDHGGKERLLHNDSRNALRRRTAPSMRNRRAASAGGRSADRCDPAAAVDRIGEMHGDY